MKSGGADSSKSAQSKMSNESMRKTSLDGTRSLGRSSNGTRTGSNERVLKLKINKSSKQHAPSDKDKKIIATI